MEEVRRLSSLQDAEINEAKKVLAYEVTKLVHGKLKLKKHNRLLKHCLEEAAHLPMSRLLKSLLLMQKVK